jgi:recombinational DNA repair ATPase RecF
VIKLESAHIEEVRGIRSLDIDFERGTFAISGPNGSGKSGVIDAIEFGLTGEMGRLSGRGTRGLSVAEHGPHVDKTKFPDAAFVELKVFIPELKTSASIRRKISAPGKPTITPEDPAVHAVFSQIAEHPEVTLSRREVLRFILVEPSKRSEEIQTLLKMEDVGQMRSALNTAQNKLQSAHRTAAAEVQSSLTALLRHLQVSELKPEAIRDAINKRRKLLSLSEITELNPATKFDSGLTASASATQFNKQSALRDLGALTEAAKKFSGLGKNEAAAILAHIGRMEADPTLLTALQRESFLEKGLQLVNEPVCPLCDTAWDDIEHLRKHIRSKLQKSGEARKLQESLLENAAGIGRATVGLIGLLGSAQNIAESQGDAACSGLLKTWKTDLESFRTKLGSVDAILGLKSRLEAGWLAVPEAFNSALQTLTETVNAKPDQAATIDAQTFLTTAQVRLEDHRAAKRRAAAAVKAHAAAKDAYDIYCSVLESQLNALYAEVEKDFSSYYRSINQDDEGKFTAKLTPSEGKLDLQVNFYERGLFPPAAYHSEGHQDGMGVCLYLALMKRLFGDRFTFALLDDVVMSVDADHRYEFCKLLKTQFPNTQFVITTHDRLWAEQMRSAGLVSRKTSLAFHGWTVETGPLVESAEEIWTEIEGALAKGRADVAAAALRRHLEYVSRLLADQLGASPLFKADGNYELGELLPSVLKRLRELYSKAAEAGQSWNDGELKKTAAERKKALTESNGALTVEQWAVNKAVHYNEWANFGKKDFEPVVAAFRALLECMRCKKCDSWLYVTPRGRPEVLRCSCSGISLNLKPQE